jgi:hypothetical protein
MPIRPENRGRYPADWKAIVARVRERSGDRCEGSPAFPDCRVKNGEVGYRVNGIWHWLGNSVDGAGEKIDAANIDGFRVVKIVLTTGHLDHVPENCALSNLRHWCQRCHLAYDAQHHSTTAYMTRRAARSNMELPL